MKSFLPSMICITCLMLMAAGCNNPIINSLLQMGTEQVVGTTGSCNEIDAKSRCTEYIGADWSWEKIQSQCTSTQMYISQYACTATDLGGCSTTYSTSSRTIIWYYTKGDQAYDEAEVAKIRKECEKNTNSAWILNSASLFKL